MDPSEAQPSTARSEPSIKRFLRHLHLHFDSLSADLTSNIQACREIKASTSSLSISTHAECNDTMNTTLTAIENLSRTFHELQKEQKGEDLFLWRQAGALNADKVKQAQTLHLLMSRVGMSETDVGTQLRLPSVD